MVFSVCFFLGAMKNLSLIGNGAASGWLAVPNGGTIRG
jgi:hypothetical protein